MRQLTLYLLFIMIAFSCGEDDDTIPQQPITPASSCETIICTHDDTFYGQCIMNGDCWKTEWTYYDQEPGALVIYLGFLSSNAAQGIGEILGFTVYSNAELSDTIWLCTPDSGNPTPNHAQAMYTYLETDAIAGQFKFDNGTPPTGDDFLLLDYINEDTTIIEGRFQVRFPVRRVNSYVDAPDTMRLECGAFRVEQF